MLVELVEDIGMPHDKIICTSIPGYGVPGGENIYAWIKKQIGNSDLRVVYLLSSNYYSSPICLNEMGAAWVTGAKETIILINQFSFSDIRGCLDSAKEGIDLSGEIQEVKYRLNEFKDMLLKEFNLPELDFSKWERRRDAFIDRYKKRDTIKQTDEKEDKELIKNIIYKLDDMQIDMLVKTYETTGELDCYFNTEACIYAGDSIIKRTTMEPTAFEMSQEVRALRELKLINAVNRWSYQLTTLGNQVASHIVIRR